MILSRSAAFKAGVFAIIAVIGLQTFNDMACYHESLGGYLEGLLIFVSPALVIACIALLTSNPLRAVGACLFFAPWLVFAYYTDCVAPYTGGGASMIYVVVLFWGAPSALIGALVAGMLFKTLGVEVAEAPARKSSPTSS
jgi:hypothetical protein